MQVIAKLPVVSGRASAKRSVRANASGSGDPLGALDNLKSSGLIGAIGPFEDGFDPLGFSANADQNTLLRYREAELTHGRVSMLASVGFLVGEAVEGKGPFFEAQVTGPAINHFQQVPTTFWFLIAGVIGLAESLRVQKGWASPFDAPKLWLLREDYQPGDLGFNPLGLGGSAEEQAEARLKELSNGRLAMLGITGMVAQELVTGLNVLPADEAFEMEGVRGVLEMEAACKNAVNEAQCAAAFEKTLEIADKAKAAAFLASEGIAP